MSALAELEVAIAAAPDDDAPRLVWADAVGGERGELVVLQCRLAREDLPAAERDALARRTAELLHSYGRMWSGFAGEPAVARCMFRRGFVEAVEANVVEMPWQRIFDIAPLVTALDIRGITQTVDHRRDAAGAGTDSVDFLRELFAQPAFERLRGIGIDDAALYEVFGDSEWDNEYTPRGDDVLALIDEGGALAGMRSLAIRDRFGARGIYSLFHANVTASLERLTLAGGDVHPVQVTMLLHALPALRALDLGDTTALRDVAAAIPASLVELRVHGPDDADVLAALACAPNLERLGAAKLPDLAAFPRLRTFERTIPDFPIVHVGTNTREPWGNYGLVS